MTERKMRGKISKRNPDLSRELSNLLVGTIATKASFWEGVSDINLSKKVSKILRLLSTSLRPPSSRSLRLRVGTL